MNHWLLKEQLRKNFWTEGTVTMSVSNTRAKKKWPSGLTLELNWHIHFMWFFWRCLFEDCYSGRKSYTYSFGVCKLENVLLHEWSIWEKLREFPSTVAYTFQAVKCHSSVGLKILVRFGFYTCEIRRQKCLATSFGPFRVTFPKEEEMQNFTRHFCTANSTRDCTRTIPAEVLLTLFWRTGEPNWEREGLKARPRGISLSEYGSEWFWVRLRGFSEYGSIAYLVERPTLETRAEHYHLGTNLYMQLCVFSGRVILRSARVCSYSFLMFEQQAIAMITIVAKIVIMIWCSLRRSDFKMLLHQESVQLQFFFANFSRAGRNRYIWQEFVGIINV